MQHSAEIAFAAEHPTAAGHFPGNPIIPGALLVDEIVHLITTPAGDGRAIVIRSAKFFRPVRPGESVQLQWRSLDDDAIAFECRVIGDDRLAAKGIIEIPPMPR